MSSAAPGGAASAGGAPPATSGNQASAAGAAPVPARQGTTSSATLSSAPSGTTTSEATAEGQAASAAAAPAPGQAGASAAAPTGAPAAAPVARGEVATGAPPGASYPAQEQVTSQPSAASSSSAAPPPAVYTGQGQPTAASQAPSSQYVVTQPNPPNAAQPCAYSTSQPTSAAAPQASDQAQQQPTSAYQQPPPAGSQQPPPTGCPIAAAATTTTERLASAVNATPTATPYTTGYPPPPPFPAVAAQQGSASTSTPGQAPAPYSASTANPPPPGQQPAAAGVPTPGPPRSSVAKVRVVRAKGLPKEMYVKPPDAYCVCRVPGRTETQFQTPVINNNSAPEWQHEKEIRNYSQGEPIEFLVYDKSRFRSDKLLGRGMLTWPTDPSHQHGFRGVLPLSGAGSAKGSNVEVQVEVSDAPPPPAPPGSPPPNGQPCGSPGPPQSRPPSPPPATSLPPNSQMPPQGMSPTSTTTVVHQGPPAAQQPPPPTQHPQQYAQQPQRHGAWNLHQDPFMTWVDPNLAQNPFMAPGQGQGPDRITVIRPGGPNQGGAGTWPYDYYGYGRTGYSAGSSSPGCSIPSGLDSPSGTMLSPLRPMILPDDSRPLAPWDGDPMDDIEWVEAYRTQVRAFIGRASQGVKCRTIVPQAALAWRATYSLSLHAGTLRLEPVGLSGLEVREISIEGIKNIWIHGDPQISNPETERLMRALELQLLTSELQGLMLLDTLDGEVAVLENTFRQREDFLDSMAVISATLRYRHLGIRPPPHAAHPNGPGIRNGYHPGRPPPIQRWPPPPVPFMSCKDGQHLLRREGTSLLSIHMNGAAGMRLAAVGEPIVPDVQVV